MPTLKTKAEKEFTEKGFQIVQLNASQILKIGGFCICDSCGTVMFISTFIGALNQAYCNPCFEEWNERAIFYEEDKFFETQITDKLISLLNS